MGYPQGCCAPLHTPYSPAEQACIFLVCTHGTCSVGCPSALVTHFLGEYVSHVYIPQTRVLYVCVSPVCVRHVYMASGLRVCPHLCTSCAYACSGHVYAPDVCTVLNSNACVTVHACVRYVRYSPCVYSWFIVYLCLCVCPHAELRQ